MSVPCPQPRKASLLTSAEAEVSLIYYPAGLQQPLHVHQGPQMSILLAGGFRETTPDTDSDPATSVSAMKADGLCDLMIAIRHAPLSPLRQCNASRRPSTRRPPKSISAAWPALSACIDIEAVGDTLLVRAARLSGVAQPYTVPESLRTELAPNSGEVMTFSVEGKQVKTLTFKDGRFTHDCGGL
jgi:hypothetical protein